MAKVYSLTTVTVVIDNSTYPGGLITIGGAGKLLGSVGYSFNNQAFSIDSTPDGGYVANFNGSKAGSVTLQMRQTSSHIPELTDFVTWCRENPEQAESKLTISDTLGNIACVCNGVFPSKQPDNSVSATAGDRRFDFVAGEIIPEERNM